MAAQLPPPPNRGAQVLDPQGKFDQTTWSAWFRRLYNVFNQNVSTLTSIQSLTSPLSSGQTVTVTLAPLTQSGSNGSLTFTNGVLTNHVNPS